MSSCCRDDSAGPGVYRPKRNRPARLGEIAFFGLLVGAAVCLALARHAISGPINAAVPSHPQPEMKASYRAPWQSPDVSGENSVQYCRHFPVISAAPTADG